MSVTTHHQQVAVEVMGQREQRIPDIGMGSVHRDFHFYAMPCEVKCNISTWLFSMRTWIFLRIEDGDLYQIRLF